MRNPCKDCIYYHKENRTCQSKKCATGGSGKVSWIDKLFCSPCKKRWTVTAMKCDTCINARAILSENGWHRVCNLSSKSALRCITGEKSQYTKFHEKESCKS